MKSKIGHIVKKARSYLLQLLLWILASVLYILAYFGVVFENRKPSLLVVVVGLYWLFYIIRNLHRCIKDEKGKT